MQECLIFSPFIVYHPKALLRKAVTSLFELSPLINSGSLEQLPKHASCGYSTWLFCEDGAWKEKRDKKKEAVTLFSHPVFTERWTESSRADRLMHPCSHQAVGPG